MNSESKFVSIKIKNFLELAKSKKNSRVLIKIVFLGSCYPASTYAKGEPYGNNKNIYYYKEIEGSSYTLVLTFSGPTMFDITKPNIASITQDAKKLLNDLIPNIGLEFKDKEIEIGVTIQGHSRGGIVANRICRWLTSSSNILHDKIKIKELSIADPYAGPLNRRINKKYDDFDDIKNPMKYSYVPKSTIAVYTVAEKRFRNPAQNLKAKTIVFTDTSHDGTRQIASCIFDSNKKYDKKLYICADPEDQINKMSYNVKYNPSQKEQIYINKYIEKNLLRPIDYNNLNDILEGRGQYKNFAYSKIASDGRRALFYTALAIENEQYKDDIKQFLLSKHKSMWKKVEKNLTKLGE